MRRTPLLGAAVTLGLVLGGAACGGGGDDDSAEDIEKQLSERLQDDGDFTEEQADCFAKVIIDEVGVEELKDVDLTADEPPEELQDDIAAAAEQAVEECDLSGLGG